MSLSAEQMQSWVGRNVLDPEGTKLGKASQVYLDEETGQPTWLTVKTGLFGTRSSFVPLAGAFEQGDDLMVAYAKDDVRDAPNVEDDGELPAEEEDALYRHYGLAESNAAFSDVGEGGPGYDTSGRSTDEAMTRSEEELAVGTRRREVGRARLRKYVVVEDVTTTVPVSHEEVRIEREPITEANVGAALDGPEISEEEHEVVLHAEEPVVEKRVVPKERVRLQTDVVTEEATVQERLRKEQVEADEGDGRRPSTKARRPADPAPARCLLRDAVAVLAQRTVL